MIKIFFLSIVLCQVACLEKPNQLSQSNNAPNQTPPNVDIIPTDDSQDRTIWQKPYVVIAKMGDLTNAVIADIGAGSGYFSFRFIHQASKVIAIDIEPQLIDMMNAEKMYYKQEIQNKFEARLAAVDDSKLSPNEIDIAFLSNTYCYLENRVNYLRNLKSKFKSKGRIVIVDFKKKLTPFGPDQKHRLAQAEVEQELLEAGYQIVESDDTSLQYQYIIIAIAQ